MKLLIMQFSPDSCYFLPLTSEYSPPQPVLKHPKYTASDQTSGLRCITYRSPSNISANTAIAIFHMKITDKEKQWYRQISWRGLGREKMNLLKCCPGLDNDLGPGVCNEGRKRGSNCNVCQHVRKTLTNETTQTLKPLWCIIHWPQKHKTHS